MIRTLTLIFATIFASTALAASMLDVVAVDSHVEVVSSDQSSIRLSTELSDLERLDVVQDGYTSTAHSIIGEGQTFEYGKPQLPAVTRVVVVPPTAGLQLVIRTDEPRRVNADQSPAVYEEEELITQNIFGYENGDVYPAMVAEMSEPYVIRGVRLVNVTTYPIRYDYSNNSYLHYDNIETEIRFTNDEPINPATHPVRKNRSRYFLNFIEGLAINGAEVGRDDPRDEEPPYVAHYCIVTNERNLEYESFGEFIEWRRRAGYKVDIISIPNNRSNDGAWQDIKERIQDLYDSYLERGEDPFDLVMLAGDRTNYGGCGQGPGHLLGAPRGNNLWGGVHIHHFDWYYGLLEGDDMYADVGISRWAAGSQTMNDLFWARTKAYEVEPNMDEPEWFTKGAVYAQKWAGNYHNSLATNVRWAKSVLESKGFDDIRLIEDMVNANVNEIGQFLTRQFNEGVNVMLGRAENYYYRNSFQGVDRNQEIGVFPIDLNIAGHHEWTTWWMLRDTDADGDHPHGPVVASTGFGGQATLAYSIVWVEEVNGFMQRDLPYGWSRVQALTAPNMYIPNWQRRFPGLAQNGAQGAASTDNACFTDVDFYGDPGIQYWQGVPQVVAADVTDEITPSTRMIEAYIFDPEDETDVAGALVTLYAPGNIPDFDDEDYPDYDGMQMWSARTDSQGMVQFVFSHDVEFETDTPMQFTVSGRNIRPLLHTIDIGRPLNDVVVEVADYTLTEVEGNENEEINPGELIDINLSAVNLSRRNEALGVTAVVTSSSPYVEIIGDNELSFGDIDSEASADAESSIRVRLSESCPDGESRPITRPRLMVEFTGNEDEVWQSALELNPIAPHFVVRDIVGSNVIDTDEDEVEIYIDLSNVGNMDATGVSAELYSLGLGVVVVQHRGDFDDIDAGSHRRMVGNRFNVSGNRLTVPGTRVEMMLMLRANNSFIDSAFFEVIVGTPAENKPLGPDNYGYICFDETDTDWEIAPEYDWIEISREERNRDFNGTACDFNGQSPSNIGETQVIDLPFDFQFYGHQYDQLTIATNGFASVGDQEYVTNFQNWPLDRCVGGLGMMAPFWDNLRFGNDGQVYYYYHNPEDETSMFIIEWYNMRSRTGGGDDMLFEIIIYDMPTETGDNTIQFQYKSISNNSSGDWMSTVPKASVGISSPDGNAGINYTYNGEYPVAAAELEDQHAILFATSPKYRSGVLHGWVYDAENDQPVEDVLVVTGFGQAARTDEEGYYSINNALATVVFNLSAIKFGYNDSSVTDLTIEDEGDTLRLDFGLLHPEFSLSNVRLSAELEPDFDTELHFDLTNDGNGPVDWRMRKRLPGNADVDPWEFRDSFFVGDSADNPRMRGVIWANEHFYCTGGGRSRRDDNFVYVFDRLGSLVTSYQQFGESNFGMGDLAWDGGLIWGGEDNTVYGFTPEGELRETFNTVFDDNQALAWDTDRQVLWITDMLEDHIIGYDRTGQEQMRVDQQNLNVYGLAYWRDDPDGFPLYIYHNIVVRDGDDLTRVHKMNPETGDTLFVAELGTEVDGKPEGAFITNQYDVYSWVFMSMANLFAQDEVQIWQLDARRDWYRMYSADDDPENRQEVFEGRMEAEETHGFTILLSSEDLPRVEFEGQFVFTHNATQASDTLKVFLDVIGNRPSTPFNLLTPADSSNYNGNIEPEIPFSWEESVDPNWGDRVRYQLWIQSGADSVLAGVTDSTTISVDLESLDIELHPRIDWWVVAESDPDRVWSNSRYHFNYIPDDVPFDLSAPVEFGLESIYPSPFNSITSIRFGMDRPENAKISIFDISGREVKVLHNGVMPAGHRKIVWNAESFPSGLYLVRLESSGRVQTAKIALIR